MFFNNNFRLLSIYGGPEWTLSSAAGTTKFWKASESGWIFSGFQIWLIKAQWIWIFATKDAKSVVCDGKFGFP